jgi:hypothetical protein
MTTNNGLQQTLFGSGYAAIVMLRLQLSSDVLGGTIATTLIE